MGNTASSLSPRTCLTQALDGFLTKVLDPARDERDKFTGSEQHKTILDDNCATFEQYYASAKSLERILVHLFNWSTTPGDGSGQRGLREKKKKTRAQTEEQMKRLAVLVERTYRRFVQKRSWFGVIGGKILAIGAIGVIAAAIALPPIALAAAIAGGIVGAGAVACFGYAFYTGRKLSVKSSFEAMTGKSTQQDLDRLITEYEKGTDDDDEDLRAVMDKVIGSSVMHSINNASNIETPLDDDDHDDGRDLLTKRSEKVAADVDHDDPICFVCYKTFNSENKAMMLNTGKLCHLHPCHLDCLERMYRDLPPGKEPRCGYCRRELRHGCAPEDWFVPA